MEKLMASIPDAAQKNLHARMDQYCLKNFQPQVENLVVTSCSSVTLSASPKEKSLIAPTMLETRDLDKLKSWIGVDDEVVKGKHMISCDSQREFRRFQKDIGLSDSRLASLVASRKTKKASKKAVAQAEYELKAQLAEQRANIADRVQSSGKLNDAIQEYTRGYLYGDSRLVKELKPVLEAHYDIFRIPLWAFLNVKVESGSTLYFGPGANVLWAYQLEIEEGGRIRSNGSLTVSVTSLKKG